MGKLDIYKRGQGKYTRVCTYAGVVGVGLIGAVYLSEKIGATNAYLKFGLPTLLLMGLAAAMYFWVVNYPSRADFMIATESEMKKVSWSSRREISGSTKVVIVTTVIIASMLFGVDFALAELFKWLRIMG